MSQTMRQTARRLLAGGYSWSEAHDPAAFERFYDRYYLPFVRARHDELAIVDKRPILRRNFSRGGVMWITTGTTRKWQAASIASTAGYSRSSSSAPWAVASRRAATGCSTR